MTLKVKILISIALIVFLIAIVNMVRKRELELKYTLAWLAADVGIILMVLIPNLLNKISAVLGIYTPVNMVFFLGFVFSIIIIFILTVALSRMSTRVRRLAQIIALEQTKTLPDKEEE